MTSTSILILGNMFLIIGSCRKFIDDRNKMLLQLARYNLTAETARYFRM